MIYLTERAVDPKSFATFWEVSETLNPHAREQIKQAMKVGKSGDWLAFLYNHPQNGKVETYIRWENVIDIQFTHNEEEKDETSI